MKMNRKTILQRAMQTVVVLVLCAAMLFGQAMPAQAAGKTSLKTVSGVKFKEGKGADKTGFARVLGMVNAGNYLMYLKEDKNGKPYLVYTKDGKNYKQTDLRKALQNTGKLSKEDVESSWIMHISVVDNEVIISGGFGNELSFQLRTKNGSSFTYHKTPDCKQLSNYSRMLKVGSTYVLLRSWIEDQDEIKENGKEIKARFKYYTSTDKKNWKSCWVELKGSKNAKGEIEYADAKRKDNHYLVLSGIGAEGKYLYFGITYRPYSSANAADRHEYYIYRTKDFKTYEKVAVSNKSLIKNMEHQEDISFTRPGAVYGITDDWDANTTDWSYSLGSFTLTYAANADSKFKEVFAYKPGNYSSKTLTYTYNWKETGEQVSLFFERQKDNSLFVSKNGTSGFKEYKTSIKASKCRGIWSDTKNGYRIMGYDDMKYLLLSKDGFIKSYQVKLPSGAQSIAIKGNLLSVTAKKGNYYISLSELYKKLK